MTSTNNFGNPCIVAGVQPLLTDLPTAVNLHLYRHDTAGRARLEDFIRSTFLRIYRAELATFYPNLAAFSADGQVRGVIGYRDGIVKPLFSEQYLDAPVEEVMAAYLQHGIARQQIVEVGNLALSSPGDARWAIAAMTVLLRSGGYRWVLFTATKPLFNTFQRLGLRPIPIATPDPKRLPDSGRQWGSYYQAAPRVYAGDIEAGYVKLITHVSDNHPKLYSLLQQARHIGMNNYVGAAQLMCAAV